MIEDAELLRRYLEDHSEVAFGELVQRHLDLVYSAALRQVNGDTHRAQDIAQIVFTDLARKAGALRRHPTLRGWLYTSTHFAAAKSVRTESRRQKREKEALVMQEILNDSASAPNWDQLQPMLDRAMHELNEDQREAILLRFFDHRPFADIAARLGVTENAARKSVDRALEKLGARLARHGITSTTGALAIVLADHAVVAAPSGMVTAVTASAVSGAAGGVGFPLLHLMATTKLKIGMIGLIAAGLGVLIFQHHGNAELAKEIGDLREQMRSRISRPASSAVSASTPSPGLRASVAVAQTAPTPAEEIRPVSTWKNVGRETPAAFIETYFWSIKEMDLDAFVATWSGLDEAGERMAQSYFEALPKDTRAKYGTAERLMAKLMMWAQTVHPIASFQVQEIEMTGPGEANVHVRLRLPNGEEQVMKGGVNIHRASDGWRSGPLPAQNVEKALYEGRYLLKFENLPSPATKSR